MTGLMTLVGTYHSGPMRIVLTRGSLRSRTLQSTMNDDGADEVVEP